MRHYWKYQKLPWLIPGTVYSELTVRVEEKDTTGVLLCLSCCLRRYNNKTANRSTTRITSTTIPVIAPHESFSTGDTGTIILSSCSEKTHSHSHYTHWQPLIFLCLTYRKSNVFRLLLIPGLQSSPGPGTHTQSPVWGSQGWLGGHEQVWAQLVPNVPVWHTAKTDIWQMFDELVEWQTYWAWSRNKKLFSAENYSMTYLFRNHIQEIWQTVFSKRNNC